MIMQITTTAISRYTEDGAGTIVTKTSEVALRAAKKKLPKAAFVGAFFVGRAIGKRLGS